jgi:phospholipid transport system substrate-binding protein
MEFLPFSEGKTDQLAVVKTLLKDPKANSSIPIDYKLRKKDSWLIYDIAVHNSSLVLNYKSEFGSEIKKGGIDGLIKVLRDKNSSS